MAAYRHPHELTVSFDVVDAADVDVEVAVDVLQEADLLEPRWRSDGRHRVAILVDAGVDGGPDVVAVTHRLAHHMTTFTYIFLAVQVYMCVCE